MEPRLNVRISATKNGDPLTKSQVPTLVDRLNLSSDEFLPWAYVYRVRKKMPL